MFRKQWTRQEARAALADFLHDQGAGVFQMESFNSEVWQTALTLSRRHTAKLGIRTLDLLHVAAVKVFKPDAFYTFDRRQRNVAKAERLRVEPA